MENKEKFGFEIVDISKIVLEGMNDYYKKDKPIEEIWDDVVRKAFEGELSKE